MGVHRSTGSHRQSETHHYTVVALTGREQGQPQITAPHLADLKPDLHRAEGLVRDFFDP